MNTDNSVNVASLFENFYEVSDFQREYVWQPEDVEQLLKDVFESFSSGSSSDYFIGAIVLSKQKENSFEIIDGQQRLSTTFIALCAINRLLITRGDSSYESYLAPKIHGTKLVNGSAEKKFKILYNYDSPNRAVANLFADKKTSDNDRDESTENLLAAYDCIYSFLAENFPEGDEGDLKNFTQFFCEKVKVLPYVASSTKQALVVFETLNSRGMSLTPIDLVKNTLFKYAATEDWDGLKQKWRKFKDILGETKEEPKRFLKYYLTCRSLEKTNENNVYDVFSEKHKSITNSQVDDTIQDLTAFATSYKNLLEGKRPNGEESITIQNIRQLSKSGRQYFPFILIADELPLEKDTFKKLALAAESFIFSYSIQSKYTGKIEQTLTDWTFNIAKCKTDEKVNVYLSSKIEPAIKAAGNDAEIAIRSLTQGIAKAKLRYLLGRIESYLDAIQHGHKFPSQPVSNYSKYEIEHIMSVSSGAEEFFVKLGNLTILEKALNRSIKDKPFEAKKTDGYANSDCLLTKGIAVHLSGNNGKAKALRLVKRFENDDWGDNQIIERQRNLSELATKTFGWA